MPPAGLRSAVLVFAMLLTACRVERTERPPLADPGSVARADIDNTLLDFAAALAERDARRATTFFTPDAVLVLGGRAAHNGRVEIAGGLEEGLLQDSASLHWSSEIIDLAGGFAWQTGTFQRAAADSVPPAHGRFVIRWQRGPEATWRMQHVMMTRFAPDTTTAGS